MRQRVVVLGGFALLGLGCSSVLGYDDLRFEGTDAGYAGSGGNTGGAGTGGAAGAATGGAPTGGGGAPTGGGGAPIGGGGAPTGGGGAPVGGGGAPTGGGGGPTGGTGGGTQTVCQRWNADRASLAEGAWSGSVGSCTAGDVAAPGRPNALKLVNLYRWMAGLPEVAGNSGMDADAQECALMMDANNALSHTPPSNWACYSAAGASAAGKSNIATAPGVQAVDLYMSDPGNPTTIGHRRWILSNSLGPIGLGSTSGYSCMMVIGGSGNANKAWTAYPPPGEVPLELFTVSFQSVDQTGWTIQSDSINLSGAQVTVTDAGANRPVTVTQLAGGYGSSSAIRFNPSGWTTQAGHTYSVSVSGAGIAYDVVVVNC